MFHYKDIDKGTWCSPDGKTVNPIDHIMKDERFTSFIRDVRTYRGNEIGSDHFLVVGKVKIKMIWNQQPKATPKPKLDIERMKELSVKEAYVIETNNRFTALQEAEEENSVEKAWERIKTVVADAAEKNTGQEKENEETEMVQRKVSESSRKVERSQDAMAA
ncbi:craniofacial development protein 2-like [Schistocerca americana]|uniref:craniofacial development protein 2-like n=1 Tax=Schistocerca americana TaxID=7009 RepID=UPI001F5022CC|nr:craniofacial development protein 2-like [Schistocerca americana]